MRRRLNGEALRYMDDMTLRRQKAEAEVAEYHELTKMQTAKIRELQTKNAKLRAVVDAARVYVTEHDKRPNLRTLDEWIIIVAAIRNALAELDEDTNGR